MMVKGLHKAESSSLSTSIVCSIFLLLLPTEVVPNFYCKLAQSLKVIQEKKVNMHFQILYITHRVQGFPNSALVHNQEQHFKIMHWKHLEKEKMCEILCVKKCVKFLLQRCPAYRER